MTATMQAVVYYGPEDVRVEETPVPQAGAGELRLKVEACAVCGTDLKSFHHGNKRLNPPLVMGHEFVGCVDQVGEGASGFAEGDRCVMATSVSCGDCVYCKKGWPNLCANVKPMGFSFPGGMAEYVVIPELGLRRGHVIKAPSGLDAAVASLAEPTSCAINSVENCGVEKGDTVLVTGAGPLGLLNACAARAAGAEKILLAEVSTERLEQAKAFDIDRLVAIGQEDLREAVMEETDGLGADVVIVAAPAVQPQEEALALVRKRGAVCLFASLPVGNNMLSLDSRLVHYNELRVVGSSDSAPRHVERAVEMLTNHTEEFGKIATHRLPLAGIFEAFDLMRSGKSLRVALIPEGAA